MSIFKKKQTETKTVVTRKTTIRARMLRLGIISVAATCVIIGAVSIFGTSSIVDKALEHSEANAAAVVESCYLMLESDMGDLASEIASDVTLGKLVTEGDKSKVSSEITRLCTDSWIKGVKVTDKSGNVIYADGWEITKEGYAVSIENVLTYTSTAPCGTGTLWLICDTVESSALGVIVEHHGLEYAAYHNNALVYSTLEGMSETFVDKTEFKIKGIPYGAQVLKFAESDGLDFVVMEDKTTLLTLENNMVLIMCILGVVIICLEIGIAQFVAVKIAKAINAVVTRLNQLDAGDLKTATPTVSSGDETEVLANALGNTLSMFNRTINEIQQFVNTVNNGDLTYKSSMQYVGDFKQVGTALETLQHSLVELVDNTQQASLQVATGASQVATGATALSQTTVEEASEMEQLSAHLQTVNAASEMNTTTATQAEQVVNEVQTIVNNGTESMQTLQQAMSAIVESTQKIEHINKTIDDIAFQTNILALNAAVEAARAGAAGKGFAVVADEVRNLASKSAEAVKTTSQLIQQAVVAVQQGTELTDVSAQNFKQTAEKMHEVTALVADVVTASRAQTEAIAEMNTGFENITQAIQNSAAVAEESAASAEEMSAQADVLNKSLERYTV